MTIAQDNAAAFAHRPDGYVQQTRHAAVREAVEILVGGQVTPHTIEQLVVTSGDPHLAAFALLNVAKYLAPISDSTTSLHTAWAAHTAALARHEHADVTSICERVRSGMHWLLRYDPIAGRVVSELCGCAIAADHTDADGDENVGEATDG